MVRSLVRPSIVLLLSACAAACAIIPPLERRDLRERNMEEAVASMADAALRTGQVETANRLYRRLLEVAPASVTARMGLGNVALGNQEPADAARWYRAALMHAVEPAERFEARLAHGRAALSAGQIGAARDSFVGLTDPRAGAPRIYVAWGHNGVGLARLLAGDARGAVEAMEQAVLTAPEESRFKGNLDRALAMLSASEGGQVARPETPPAPPLEPPPEPPRERLPPEPPPEPLPEPPRERLPPEPPSEPLPEPPRARLPLVENVDTAPVSTPAAASPEVPDAVRVPIRTTNLMADRQPRSTPADTTPEDSVAAGHPAPEPEPVALAPPDAEPADPGRDPEPVVLAPPDAEPVDPGPADMTPQDAEPVAFPDPQRVDVAPLAEPVDLVPPDPEPPADVAPPEPEPVNLALLDPDPVAAAVETPLGGTDVAERTPEVDPAANATPGPLPRGYVVLEHRLPFVQFGAYSKPQAAATTAAALDALTDWRVGTSAAPVADGGRLHRVRVGPIPSRDALSELIDVLASHGYRVSNPSVVAEVPKVPLGDLVAWPVYDDGERFLQVGAFGERPVAEGLAAALRSLTDREVRVGAVASGNGVMLHRVRIGPVDAGARLADLLTP